MESTCYVHVASKLALLGTPITARSVMVVNFPFTSWLWRRRFPPLLNVFCARSIQRRHSTMPFTSRHTTTRL
ncbi:hypothetical protein PENTCL1PPCAC_13266 [Pristionchus entomophagus]|uniref:G protein-coupled receptor n=1 Tax=Pristionchus entomophagus TaxID=358040 RepID=A0AAV5T6A6_9BILA|nr:hypothetical protein PENTCL1PPCAC_13266 [Pristionchus entomophagus]